jgi:hypothetical protein
MLQRHPVEVLHNDEGLAVVFANLVNGADVRVIQSRGRPGFTLETFERLRTRGDVLRQKLECYEAAELEVLGLVNHAHAAPAELIDNAVMRNGLADHGLGGASW